MNFLEAHRLVKEFAGGPPWPLRIALSGTGEPLELYAKAAGVKHGIALVPSLLPFNTLGQHLRSPADGAREVIVLLPWDLAPELDWRSGAPARAPEEGELLDRARETAALVAGRSSPVFYLPAPVPPVGPDPTRLAALGLTLRGIAAGIGAVELPGAFFSLASYLASGSPFAGASLGAVATSLVEAVAATRRASAKVLVSDLDNVMWRGVVAEDGPDGIAFAAQGPGYPYFVYQTLLARLKGEGVVLAAVSRNDQEVALGPFQQGRMVLREEDFVAIIASYHAKSAQVRALADQLNLGLDAFVFVDDNPVELTEMGLKLPEVRCEAFPEKSDELPAFFDRLNAHFRRASVTAEDRERTELYRRRLAGMVPSAAAGADLRSFLEALEMTLVVHDRSQGDRQRAVQLINKTNQFNINGRRVSDEEVAEVITAGGRLVTGTLSDKHGTHGEVIAILIDGTGVVKSFVMSCRVFQRQAEVAFLRWLATGPGAPRSLEVATTPRNEPARQFLADPAFRSSGNGGVSFDGAAFAAAHADVATLIRLVEQS